MSATVYPQSFELPNIHPRFLQHPLNVELPQDELSYDAKINGKDVSGWDTYIQWKREHRDINDAEYPLIQQEIQHIYENILPVLHWQDRWGDAFTNLDIGRGITKYTFAKYNQIGPANAPQRTQTFESKWDAGVNKATTDLELHGWQYDFHIPRTWIDAQNNSKAVFHFNSDMYTDTMTECVRSLAEARQYFLFNGTQVSGLFDDVAIKGLCNNASLTAPPSLGLGADNDLTEYGDVVKSANILATQLVTRKATPPFGLWLSPGVWAQAAVNINPYNSKSDLQVIMEMCGIDPKPGVNQQGGMFSFCLPNPFILQSTTETNATGAMCCVKPSDVTARSIESYPLSAYPMPQITMGIDAKVLWMGITEVRRPEWVAFKNSLTTASFAA